jgi:hypothetical protein
MEDRAMTAPEVLDLARDAIVLFMVVVSPLALIGLAVGDYWIGRRREEEREGA